jgi:hypothetical protein
MVMERTQAATFGQDSISMLEKPFKLKIKMLVDSLVMKSFKTTVPRYFLQLVVHKVKKHDTSHFESNNTYEELDAPILGFRSCLKERLQALSCSSQHHQ